MKTQNVRVGATVNPQYQEDPADSFRVIVTNWAGAEQCRCTLGEFVRDNAEAFPKRLRDRMARNIRERIVALGVDRLNLGAHGMFEFRAE